MNAFIVVVSVASIMLFVGVLRRMWKRRVDRVPPPGPTFFEWMNERYTTEDVARYNDARIAQIAAEDALRAKRN